MFINIAIKVFRLSIFVIVILKLSNIYRCFFASIGNFWSSSIIMFTFYRFISYPTKVIPTFYFFNISGTTMSGYLSIGVMILLLTFFFNKNITYILLISAFMANTSNLIMKSVICFFLHLKVSIFHLASTTLFLLLNFILTSLTNLF